VTKYLAARWLPVIVGAGRTGVYTECEPSREPVMLNLAPASPPCLWVLVIHTPMNQASYDLARLTRNGLITRVPHRNWYSLTCDDLKFAI
jgi:hypothetical protein